MTALTIQNISENWISEPILNRSCSNRIIVVICDLFWIALSGVICIPPVLAALSESNGSLWQKFLAIGSAAGTGLDWFILTAYGGIVLIHSISTKRQQREEKLLFEKNSPLCVRILQIALSIILGLTTRAPALTEAILFSKSNGTWLGITTAVGEAGLPALGQYLQIELVKDFLNKCCCRRKEDLSIEKIRKLLIKVTQATLSYALSTTIEERKRQFVWLYRTRSQNETRQIQVGLEELLSSISATYRDQIVRKKNSCKQTAQLGGLRVLQFGACLNVIGLFVMDALLAKTAYQLLQVEGYSTLGMTLAVIPLLYVVPKMAVDGTRKTAHLIFDLFGVTRQDKSFSELFYPKLVNFLKISCALLSVLQFEEQIALTKIYTPIGSLEGRLLSISNIVACSLIISCSYYEFIEQCCEKYAKSRWAEEDVQKAIYLKEYLTRFIALLKNIRPSSLRRLLESIDDHSLKKALLEEALSKQELMEFLQQNESDPLLAVF